MNLPAIPAAIEPARRMWQAHVWLAVSLAAAAVCAVLWLKGFWAFKATMFLVYALSVRGLQVLIGGSGQVSLGHGAFFAVGAYTAGVLVMQAGLPALATIPVAALVCAIAGFLFGIPAVRLMGPYLALATFALALALPQLFKHPAFEGWTGGVSGLSLNPAASPVPFLSTDQWVLLGAIAWTALGYLAIRRLMAGPCGLAWISLRDQPTAAAAAGVHVSLWKAIAFAVSAGVVGAAGALNTAVTNFASPDNFTVFLSLSLLVGVSIAGPKSAIGSLVAAAFLVFIPDVAEKISREWTGVVYGLVMLASVYVLPALQRLWAQRKFKGK